MNAEEYAKQFNFKPRQKESVITPFREDLLKLRRMGASYGQLLDFLRVNGIVVAYPTLSLWMRRHMPDEVLPPTKTQTSKSAALPQEQPTTKVPSPTEALPLAPSAPKEPAPLTTTAPGVLERKRIPEVNPDDFLK